MKKVEIIDKEYDLPTSWDDITVGMFEKIVKHSSLLNEYKSKTLFAVEMFAILLDAPVELVKRLTSESFNKISDEVEWVNSEPMRKKVDKFEVNNELWVPIKDFNKLTVGESVDLETVIADSKPEEILASILPILIRRARPVNKNGETVLEPTEFESDKYEETKELFKKELKVTEVMSIRDFFLGSEK